ncbi:MAG: hypothetical protein GY909_14015 [Oligoflexia bacterium]|nr:hypothetical protein [Oligoflexia bacterium]
MANHKTNTEKVFIEIETTELSSAHVRILKTLNKMLVHVMTTDEEGEYFDGSAEAMRMCASLIKQARFIQEVEDSSIPYDEQALEYSIDLLQDQMNAAKVVTYDC